MMPITDFHTYGELVYSLQGLYPGVVRSTLVLASIGPTLAKVEGQVLFEADVALDVWEPAPILTTNTFPPISSETEFRLLI